MRAELAARCQRELRPAEHRLAEARVAVDLRDRGHRDRVRRRAAPAHCIGHVALVVGAVEPSSVPAAREAHVQPEERPTTLRAGRHRARGRDARHRSAAPERDPSALRARGGRVARDHAQVVRERGHRGERAAPVVDRRSLRKDRRRPVIERRNPVRSRVCAALARRSASAKRVVVSTMRPSYGCRRMCVGASAPAFPGKTIGSSGAWWLKLQFSMKLTPCRSARDASPVFGFSPANAAGPSNAATTVRTPAAAIRISALTSTSPGRNDETALREVRHRAVGFP